MLSTDAVGQETRIDSIFLSDIYCLLFGSLVSSSLLPAS